MYINKISFILKSYFIFCLTLHIFVPLISFYGFGLHLRRSSYQVDFDEYNTSVLLIVLSFLIGWVLNEISNKRPKIEKLKEFRFGRLFLIYSMGFLLLSSFLRVYLGNLDGYFWNQLLFQANFILLIFNLLHIKNRALLFITYTPFLLLNASKGDAVWLGIIFIVVVYAATKKLPVMKLAFIAILALCLLTVQIYFRGEVGLNIINTLFEKIVLRIYGLEGLYSYLDKGDLINVLYVELSSMLPFFDPYYPRPGVTFAEFFYPVDNEYFGGNSSMYRSMFILPYQIFGLAAVVILGYLLNMVLTISSNDSIYAISSKIFFGIQAVNFTNGAYSFVLLNVIASMMVLYFLYNLSRARV